MSGGERRFDEDQLERARNADLLATAERLGAGLKRSSRTSEFVGPCPLCGGNDRFAINLKKHVWNCRGCKKGGNEGISLVMHVNDCAFQDAVAFLIGEDINPAISRTQPKPAKNPAADEHDAFTEWLVAGIVRELVPIHGTPGERYLAEIRKIDVAAIEDVLSRTDAIAWHPSVLFRQDGHPLDRKRLGCIVGVMTDPVTAKPTGAISRTYLSEGGKIGKSRTLGAPAGIVRLSEDADVLFGLHLAEGVETALSAMAKGFRPMWATGSTALMAKFPVLGVIEFLTVIADHDRNRAGEEAAREAEARWLAAGRKVRLRRPKQFGDFNDAIAGEAK